LPERDNVVGVLVRYPQTLSFPIDEKITGRLSPGVLVPDERDHPGLIDLVYSQRIVATVGHVEETAIGVDVYIGSGILPMEVGRKTKYTVGPHRKGTCRLIIIQYGDSRRQLLGRVHHRSIRVKGQMARTTPGLYRDKRNVCIGYRSVGRIKPIAVNLVRSKVRYQHEVVVGRDHR